MSNRTFIDEDNKMPDDNGVERARQYDRLARRSRRRSLGKWLLLPILLILAAGSVVAWKHFSVRESTDDAQIDGHINPIAPKVGGTVISVNVHDNEQVQAGTVLVEIDPRDFKVALDKAKADLAAAEAAARAAQTQVPVSSTTTLSQVSTAQASMNRAEATRNVAEKEVETARARLASAEARLRELEANYKKALQDLERMKQLIAKDEISRQAYDAAVAAADAAWAGRDSATATVSEAQQGIAAAQARVAEAQGGIDEASAALRAAHTGPQQVAITEARALTAEAQVRQARAVVDQAQLNVDYTIIRAPISGTISKKNVEVGQVIQAGQPLMAIVPLNDIWVTANYKESQLKNMHPGQPVTISVDAYGGRKYHGRINSIAAATGARFSLLPPENATGNYVKVVQRIPVKILIDEGQDPEHLLRPGMSVEATVLTK